MTKTRVVFAALLSLGAAFLAGCLFVSAPSTGTVEGYVTDHLSGEAVAGATVKAWPLGGANPMYSVGSPYYGTSTVTDGRGFYRLVLPEGLYVLEVRKDGHATSRVEGVKVASTARVDIVQKPVVNPNWSLTPPTVTITGISEGATVSGPVNVTINAQGPNDILYIYAAFGKMPGASLLTAPRELRTNTYTTGTLTINPATYGVSGWTTFEVVVYDYNENRTHVIYRVYVTPASDPVSIAPPLEPTANILTDAVFGVLIPARTALAVTLNKKVAFYGLEPTAAPAGGNVYVELRWRRSASDTGGGAITGYRIYRKLAGEADFRLLYTVAAPGASTYLYRDSTPDLQVGVTATYRIVAYRGNVESAPLEASCTPLPTWDVRLVSPADEAKDVDLFPTFTWAPTAIVGTTQFYQLAFWDMPHGDTAGIVIRVLNATSAQYTGISGSAWERLQPHRMYHWEMRAAFAIDVTTANAVSIATNNGYTTVFPTQTPWEIFTFTTRGW
ncbi:MAG: carboxypeptidase regulatory-like domain-containing protein [Candidatus Bipolaricaulota bacterium]|nr:carboxypeptidase regulatory-like domain-containing protein [Candidatus Bipolaricaulota bacterium]